MRRRHDSTSTHVTKLCATGWDKLAPSELFYQTVFSYHHHHRHRQHYHH